jgi:hypothetical protein
MAKQNQGDQLSCTTRSKELLSTTSDTTVKYNEESSLLAGTSSTASGLIRLRQQRGKKSASIPIQNHMKRTESELQLYMDEEMADIRDFLFFARLVNGIARHQRGASEESSWLQQETDECLANIVGTRSGCRDGNCSNRACANNRAKYSSNDAPPTCWCGDQMCLQMTNQGISNETDAIFEMDM